MRYIEKSCEPEFFKQFKEDFKTKEGREPSYKDFREYGDYHSLKTTIIAEQFGLCCYCMKEIKDYSSHIEHFKPQSQYPREVVNYDNMLVSCDGVKDNKENCGHKKDNWYHEYYTVSPLMPDCEKLFTYTTDGNIRPNKNNTRASETIDKLELNSYLLIRARRSAIYNSGLFDERDADEIKQLIKFYSTPEDGQLIGFCNAIIYCMKKALE